MFAIFNSLMSAFNLCSLLVIQIIYNVPKAQFMPKAIYEGAAFNSCNLVAIHFFAHSHAKKFAK